MTPPYSLTRLAEADLDEIWTYGASESPGAADRFLDAFAEKFLLLARFPRLGRVRDELRPGLRSVLVKNYVVFYQVTGGHVTIVRILHGSRDFESMF